jgi:hypothetical protein
MKTILRHAACAAALMATAAAHATTYEFSYDFLNGDVVSGSFDGTAKDNLINDVSNISVSVNGAAFPGTVSASSHTGLGSAVFSFDGLANNFLLRGSNTRYLLLSFAATGSATDIINFSTPAGSYAEGPGFVSYDASRWHVSAVPEPVTYAMLLGGLGLIGAITRRSNKSA